MDTIAVKKKIGIVRGVQKISSRCDINYIIFVFKPKIKIGGGFPFFKINIIFLISQNLWSSRITFQVVNAAEVTVLSGNSRDDLVAASFLGNGLIPQNESKEHEHFTLQLIVKCLHAYTDNVQRTLFINHKGNPLLNVKKGQSRRSDSTFLKRPPLLFKT